jgi:hypothetical protein
VISWSSATRAGWSLLGTGKGSKQTSAASLRIPSVVKAINVTGEFAIVAARQSWLTTWALVIV